MYFYVMDFSHILRKPDKFKKAGKLMGLCLGVLGRSCMKGLKIRRVIELKLLLSVGNLQ